MHEPISTDSRHAHERSVSTSSMLSAFSVTPPMTPMNPATTAAAAAAAAAVTMQSLRLLNPAPEGHFSAASPSTTAEHGISPHLQSLAYPVMSPPMHETDIHHDHHDGDNDVSDSHHNHARAHARSHHKHTTSMSSVEPPSPKFSPRSLSMSNTDILRPLSDNDEFEDSMTTPVSPVHTGFSLTSPSSAPHHLPHGNIAQHESIPREHHTKTQSVSTLDFQHRAPSSSGETALTPTQGEGASTERPAEEAAGTPSARYALEELDATAAILESFPESDATMRVSCDAPPPNSQNADETLSIQLPPVADLQPGTLSARYALNELDATDAILESFPASADIPMRVSCDASPNSAASSPSSVASSPSAPSNPTNDLPEPPEDEPSKSYTIGRDGRVAMSPSVSRSMGMSMSRSVGMSMSRSIGVSMSAGNVQAVSQKKPSQTLGESKWSSVRLKSRKFSRAKQRSMEAIAAYDGLTSLARPSPFSEGASSTDVAAASTASPAIASPSASVSSESAADSNVAEPPAAPIGSTDFFSLILQYQPKLEEAGLMSMEEIRDVDESELTKLGVSRDHAKVMQAYLLELKEANDLLLEADEEGTPTTAPTKSRKLRRRFPWRRADSDNAKVATPSTESPKGADADSVVSVSKKKRRTLSLRFMRGGGGASASSRKSDDSISLTETLCDESPVIDLLVVAGLIQYNTLFEDTGFESVGDVRGMSKGGLKKLGMKGRHAGRLLKSLPSLEGQNFKSDESTKMSKLKSALKKGAVAAVEKLEGANEDGGGECEEDGGGDEDASADVDQDENDTSSASSMNILKRGLAAVAKKGADAALGMLVDDGDEDDGEDEDEGEVEDEDEPQEDDGEDEEDEDGGSFFTRSLKVGAKMAMKKLAGEDDEESDGDEKEPTKKQTRSAPRKATKKQTRSSSRKPTSRTKPASLAKENPVGESATSAGRSGGDGDSSKEMMSRLLKKGAMMGSKFAAEKLGIGETGGDEEKAEDEDESMGGKLKGWLGKGVEHLTERLQGGEDEDDGEEEDAQGGDEDEEDEEENDAVGGVLKGLLGKGAEMIAEKVGGNEDDSDNEGEDGDEGDAEDEDGDDAGSSFTQLLAKGAEMVADELGGDDDDNDEEDGNEDSQELRPASSSEEEDDSEEEDESRSAWKNSLRFLAKAGAEAVVEHLGGSDEEEASEGECEEKGDEEKDEDGEGEEESENKDASSTFTSLLTKGAEVLLENLDDDEEGEEGGDAVEDEQDGSDAEEEEEEEEEEKDSALKSGLKFLAKKGASALTAHLDEVENEEEDAENGDGAEEGGEEEEVGEEEEDRENESSSGMLKSLLVKGAEMVADKLEDDCEDESDHDDDAEDEERAEVATPKKSKKPKKKTSRGKDAEAVAETPATAGGKKRAYMKKFLKKGVGAAMKSAKSALPELITGTLRNDEDGADADEK